MGGPSLTWSAPSPLYLEILFSNLSTSYPTRSWVTTPPGAARCTPQVQPPHSRSNYPTCRGSSPTRPLWKDSRGRRIHTSAPLVNPPFPQHWTIRSSGLRFGCFYFNQYLAMVISNTTNLFINSSCYKWHLIVCPVISIIMQHPIFYSKKYATPISY